MLSVKEKIVTWADWKVVLDWLSDDAFVDALGVVAAFRAGHGRRVQVPFMDACAVLRRCVKKKMIVSSPRDTLDTHLEDLRNGHWREDGWGSGVLGQAFQALGMLIALDALVAHDVAAAHRLSLFAGGLLELKELLDSEATGEWQKQLRNIADSVADYHVIAQDVGRVRS